MDKFLARILDIGGRIGRAGHPPTHKLSIKATKLIANKLKIAENNGYLDLYQVCEQDC